MHQNFISQNKEKIYTLNYILTYVCTRYVALLLFKRESSKFCERLFLVSFDCKFFFVDLRVNLVRSSLVCITIRLPVLAFALECEAPTFVYNSCPQQSLVSMTRGRFL